MSTYERYVLPADRHTWDVPASGAARFSWEYDDGRERLLALYQKGKDKQWDANTRIDWSQEIDRGRPLGIPDESLAIYGTPIWNKMSEANKDEVRLHLASWQFSQFLHGEQGAMICSARIVESVPDLDAKFYATTQTIDESRHVEVYARFCEQKLGIVYPINPNL
nr:ferritin-like domain-containing protein [Micromonospora sp. DSM 115978]